MKNSLYYILSISGAFFTALILGGFFNELGDVPCGLIGFAFNLLIVTFIFGFFILIGKIARNERNVWLLQLLLFVSSMLLFFAIKYHFIEVYEYRVERIEMAQETCSSSFVVNYIFSNQ